MRIHTHYLIATIALLFPASGLQAQYAPARDTRFHSGLSVRIGLGQYSVRDEYISAEKYSGTLPYLSARWARLNESGGYQLEVKHRNSNEIRNHAISSTVTQFSLSLDFLHHVATPSLFSREVHVFLGPSAEFYVYANEHNIAGNALDLIISFAGLLSAGVNASVVLPLGDRFQATASLRSSLLSLGMRMVDVMEDDESPFKFLPAPSGVNATTSLGFRYYLLDRLSLNAGYELQVLRINPWDYLLAVSDNLTVGVTVGL